MPQLLALEWTEEEARVAVGSSRGGRVVVEQALAVRFRGGQAEAGPSDTEIGQQIAAALAARGIARGECLVAVPRSSIELRQFQLPAAPEEELPDMVRFQAMREFSELGDDWRLDYLAIDDDASGPRNVLAAAISPGAMARVEAVCQAAGLQARRLAPRPCAAAALVAKNRPARPDELRLLVDLLADEVELTAVLGRKVIFMRTARTGGEKAGAGASRDAESSESTADRSQPIPSSAKDLLAEIRRTMAAVQNQWGGRRVESIVLCGTRESHSELARSLQDCLGTPTALFDPFAGLQLGRGPHETSPGSAGRFAPVLGLLMTESERTGHSLDFLNPRRPAQRTGRRKHYILAGVAAAVLVLAWLVYLRVDHYLLASEVQELKQKSKELDAAVARAEKNAASGKEIGKWMDTDVIWLDQLRALSEEEGFPSREDAMLTQLTIGPPPSGASGVGGEMVLKGLVRKAEIIAAMEDKLRNGSRRVVPGESREDRTTRVYSWGFKAAVSVPKETRP